MGRRAVVLVSGGLDSAVALAIAKADTYECHALTVSYGQRHSGELEAARKVALGCASHHMVECDLRSIGGSALTGDIDVPKGEFPPQGVPVTYVPARNLVFLSLALGLAEVTRSEAVFIGANVVDYSGYPDCRPEFLRAFEQLAAVGTKAGVEGAGIKVAAPLLHWDKAAIILEGLRLNVDLSVTRSCYDPDPDDGSCGHCDSCIIRRRAFETVGIPDPALSVSGG